MPHPKWKQFERDIAAWARGVRQGSRGYAEADVIGESATFECKSRNDVPKWILEAFDQAALNGRLYPHLDNFVAIGAHFGRGYPIRVFIAKEVPLREEDYDSVSGVFKDVLACLIPPAKAEEETSSD